jgi:hypothetical protein
VNPYSGVSILRITFFHSKSKKRCFEHIKTHAIGMQPAERERRAGCIFNNLQALSFHSQLQPNGNFTVYLITGIKRARIKTNQISIGEWIIK